jgi:diguanylate cyclase (GGDEF)-like protein
MLPNTFLDRLKELMSLKVEELRGEASEEFARASADAAKRGHQSPSSTTGIRHMVQVHLTKKCIDAVLENERKLVLALQLPFSETLAADLKTQVELYVSREWCEELLKKNGGLSPEHASRLKEDLFKERTFALRKVGAQIDFLVDSIRTHQTSQTQAQAKELAQKFKILWSPGQAEKDFQGWQKELQDGDSIAVVFLDIDNFKQLNTRFTENRIDATLLPEVQRLLKRSVTGRGDAYHQGGDEFILILPNVDSSEAMQFLEKLRKAFENHKFVMDGEPVPITLSIGVALWPNHGASYGEISQKANEAEHESKVTRNFVTLAGE